MLLAQVEPEFGIARVLGAFVGLVIPAAVLFYALRSQSEPDRSRRCALALALVMGAWAWSSLAYVLFLLSGAAWMVSVSALVAIPLVLAGVVMAVLGLLDVAGSARPKQGKGQAVSTLIVGGLILIIGILAVLKGDGVPDGWRIEGPLPPGARASVPAKNFSLQVPTEEWVQVIPQKLNGQADLAFVDPKRKLSFVVLAYALPRGAFVTPDKLLELSRNEIKHIDAGARLGEPQPEVTGTFPGVAFSADANAAGKEVTYRVWLYPHNNFAYLLLLWGPRNAADTIQLESSRFVKGFEVLAP